LFYKRQKLAFVS